MSRSVAGIGWFVAATNVSGVSSFSQSTGNKSRDHRVQARITPHHPGPTDGVRPMNRRQVAAIVFTVSVALGLCHALCYSTMLPDRVATHFNTAGTPDGWSTRSTMIDLQLTIIVLVAAGFLLAAGAVLRSPARWLGLPHRDWWLAPDRSEQTRRDLAIRLLWLGAFTQILCCDLFHHTVRVNLGRVAALESYWLDIGGFLAVAVVWLIVLVWRYARVPDAAA